MARWAMQVLHVNLADEGAGTPPDTRPVYLAQYDLEAMDGRGMADFTHDPDRARTWPTMVALHHAWRQQSTVRPLRADGKPNRPLTAITMTAVDLDAKEHQP